MEIIKKFPDIKGIHAYNQLVDENASPHFKERGSWKCGWGNKLWGNVVLVSVVHRDDEKYNGIYYKEEDIRRLCIGRAFVALTLKKHGIKDKDLFRELGLTGYVK